MTIAFSWQNSVSLCPASVCTPRPNLPVTPSVSWIPTFAFQFPMMKGMFLFGVSSRRPVSLHRTIQLQLFWHKWFVLLWCWMVCLGNKLRSFFHFWDYTQVLHFGLSCWLWGLLTSSKGFLPTAVDIVVTWTQVAPFPSILVHWFWNVDVHSCHLLFDYI